MRAVSPHENDQQVVMEQEGEGVRVEEGLFEKVFGESVGETLKETSEEGKQSES